MPDADIHVEGEFPLFYVVFFSCWGKQLSILCIRGDDVVVPYPRIVSAWYVIRRLPSINQVVASAVLLTSFAGVRERARVSFCWFCFVFVRLQKLPPLG